MSEDLMNQIAKLLSGKTVETPVNVTDEMKSAPGREKIKLLRMQLKEGQVMIAHPSVSKILTKREVKK